MGAVGFRNRIIERALTCGKNAVEKKGTLQMPMRIELTPLNFFLFMLPPLVWNIIFASRLDMSAFSGTVPKPYEAVEWLLRMGALLFPIFLPIKTNAPLFFPGLVLYATGLILYAASWLPFMSKPSAKGPQSPLFLFAPTYLPLTWLGGVSLMSGSWIHACVSAAFIGFHVGEYARRFGRAKNQIHR